MNRSDIQFVEPLADIEKNARERLRITIETNGRGIAHVNLREWSHSGDNLKPGRDGVKIRSDYLHVVLEALKRADARINGCGER